MNLVFLVIQYKIIMNKQFIKPIDKKNILSIL